MPAAQVTVQFVNPPKKNPKFGSIKTAEYGYISVPTQALGEFRKGGRYTIEMEEVGEYKNFIRFAGQRPQQAQAQPIPQRRAALPPQPVVAKRSHPVPQPPLPFNKPDDNGRAIFITGIVGRAMGSGNFHATDIHTLTAAAAAAWDQVVLGVEQPEPVPQYTAEEAFDDGLPPVDMYSDNQNYTSVDQDRIIY